MTKSERARRVRQLLKRVRELTRYPESWRVEIGLRERPVYLTEPPKTVSQAIPPDDELWDYRSIDEWAAMDTYDVWNGGKRSGTPKDGEVVHIYLSSNGELQDVITGWIGTKDHDPILVHVPWLFAFHRNYAVWRIIRGKNGSDTIEGNAFGHGHTIDGKRNAIELAKKMASKAGENEEIYVVPRAPGSSQLVTDLCWMAMERIHAE